MECTSTRLPYRQTGAFSKIALDYIDQSAALKPFYTHPPTLQGIKKAIEVRKQFAVNREVLVQELKKQYEGVATSEKVKANIEALLSANTFTITTAHQNNIFTGPLYFIYKIVHAIKLADHLKTSLPKQHFVPVFYIGSEDADLDELNHIYIGGEKLVWETKQTGAVGRMKVDKGLIKLIGSMEGQLSVLPNGKEIIAQLKQYYTEGASIQDATFRFVNTLFEAYGLVVLLPDNAHFKKQMSAVFEDDLLHQHASGIVQKADKELEAAGYKVQANPREINLFYLQDDKRERIEKLDEQWVVVNGNKRFSQSELLNELNEHPERFSPNVILRGLYQETILPNLAFIGGGGETAYWLELINRLVARESKNPTTLNGSLAELENLYDAFKKQAASVDGTLEKHVDSLKSKTLYRLQELEKKMLRAEKRKFVDQQRQIHSIKKYLFPGGGLQERKENLAYYHAKWGEAFIPQLYDHSLCLEQEFVIITENSK